MDYLIHFHLFAAIAWIGGSIFMFVLGIALTEKQQQKEVYPHVGPIFGYFELVSLIVLIFTGILIIFSNGLLDILFSDESTDVIVYLRNKLLIVVFVIIATAIHFIVAHKTNNIQRTKLQNLLSRGSSLFIFFANLFIMHYAIMIRLIL